MTADVEQLPAAPWLGHDPERGDLHGFSHDEVRAIVAHATAAKDAEIEALRVRADAMAGEAIKHEARAERLAEALRDIESRPWNGVRPIQIAARAALRDHDSVEST